MSQGDKCEEVNAWLKDAIKAIIKNHYGDAIKVDFNNLAICIDNRCAQFKSYDGMLLALVAIDFFMHTLPNNGGNPSEKNLNTTVFS